MVSFYWCMASAASARASVHGGYRTVQAAAASPSDSVVRSTRVTMCLMNMQSEHQWQPLLLTCEPRAQQDGRKHPHRSCSQAHQHRHATNVLQVMVKCSHTALAVWRRFRQHNCKARETLLMQPNAAVWCPKWHHRLQSTWNMHFYCCCGCFEHVPVYLTGCSYCVPC